MRSPLLVLAVSIGMTSLASGAFAASDSDFLKKALEGDNSEVALGQLAEKQGASEGTRAFGTMLATDHAAAKAAALPVAKAHGVDDTSDLTAEATAESAKLGGLSGKAFDREFARYMVKDHKKDIAEFQKEAKSGDTETAALAKDTLPALKKHLATAEKLKSSKS